MLSKKQFCDIMQRLIEQHDENEIWYKKAEEFAYGITMSLLDHDYYEILMDTLKVAMNDKNEWIEHFMSSNYRGWSWFSVWDKDNVEHKIKSFEDLYDLITEK